VKPLVVAKGRLPSDGGLRRHLQAATVALEREARMIDVRTVISRYFPEFEKELPGYLSKA
jgi:hypothetical protein